MGVISEKRSIANDRKPQRSRRKIIQPIPIIPNQPGINNNNIKIIDSVISIAQSILVNAAEKYTCKDDSNSQIIEECFRVSYPNYTKIKYIKLNAFS